MATLEVAGMVKRFGVLTVLGGVDLLVPDGRFHALLGPSGSGKTTLLRLVAGFIDPDEGRVRIGGQDVTAVPPERRNVGIVFQNYALFAHLNVFDNVAFGLEMRRRSKRAIRTAVDEALDLVQLGGLGGRYPRELSGGQQQRVALARALVVEPQLLLLDEPLSALDRKIRTEMRAELKRIQATSGVTTLLVTHDQEEALSLADEVMVLDEGRLRQVGTPWTVYNRPSDLFVSTFVGTTNVIRGTLRVTGDEVVVDAGDVCIAVADGAAALGDLATVDACVRPESLRVLTTAAAGRNLLEGAVTDLTFVGPAASVEVRVGDRTITATVLSPYARDLPEGTKVWLSFEPEAVRCFPAGAAKGAGDGVSDGT